MAYRFATSISSTGTQYDLGTADSLSVPLGVNVISEDGTAIVGSGTETKISVFGYVGGANFGMYLVTSGTTTVTNRVVKIGETGILDAGSTAISDFGSGDRIYNSGEIYGTTGISFSSSAAVSTGFVTNYGTINAPVGIISFSPALKIYNFGTIDGSETSAIITSFGDDLLVNRGQINGFVGLGNGNDKVVNQGTIVGEVNLTAGDDMVVNRGQIDGLVQLGEGTDTLINRGLINGNVGLGDSGDTLDNRGGTIDGLIGLGDGNDTFIPGVSAETAEGGIGEDSIDFSHTGGVNFALDGSIDATGVASDDSYANFEDLFGSVTGSDILVGDSFGNTIAGFGGNDIISGQGGNDLLLGGRGNDKVNGGAGEDELRGGDGNDVLNGGAGWDRMTGGPGADKFIFATGDIVIGPTSDKVETIFDFNRAEKDIADFSQIDANTLKSGNQAFVFIGNTAFHKVAGELRFDVVPYGVLVQADADGDGKSDFYLNFDGLTSVVAGDFVL